MLLNLAKIRKNFGAVEKFHFSENWPAFTYADETIEFTSPVEVELGVANLANSIALSGQVQTDIVSVCSRCLKTFSTPVRTSFELQLCHYSDLPAFRADQPETEEEDVVTWESDEMDLQPLLREQIVLALPMKSLCSVDCKGLCAKCGQDLNLGECGCDLRTVDPRLAGLAEFFNK